jgi:hypothetical protein
MRLKQPFRRPSAGALSAPLRGLTAVVIEVLRIGREMLVIPAQLWLALAEILGAAVLAVWRRIWPLLVVAFELARSALGWAERNVRPADGLLAVALVAAVALAASQFADYRGISVGTSAYAGVESVAPAPEVGREEAGSAHAWVMLPFAALAVGIVVRAALGRWRLARLLLPVGIAVIAVSLVIDAPKGLDEGAARVRYEGAEASLLEGFWAQLMAGVVLIACGLLVERLKPAGAAARAPRSVAARGDRGTEGDLGSSPLGSPPIGWEKSA